MLDNLVFQPSEHDSQYEYISNKFNHPQTMPDLLLEYMQH